MPEETTSKKLRIEEEKSVTQTDSQDGPVIVAHKLGFWNSRKLWMTLLAIILNSTAYWMEVRYLYTFISPEHITAFVGITRDFHFTTTAVLLAYLGVQGVVDWKHGTTSAVSSAASFIKEKIEESREETTNQNVNITTTVREFGVNAPELKPFGETAIGDKEEGEHYDFEREESADAQGN